MLFESLRPTPELSFAVRHLHTFAGNYDYSRVITQQLTTDIKYTAKTAVKCLQKDADALTAYVRQVAKSA